MSTNCLKKQYQAKNFRRFTYQAKTLWIHDHWTLTHLSIKNTKPTDLSIVSQTPLYVQRLLKKPVLSQNFSAFHIPSQNCVDSRSLDPNTLMHKNTKPTDLSIVSQTHYMSKNCLKKSTKPKFFGVSHTKPKLCGFTIIGF